MTRSLSASLLFLVVSVFDSADAVSCHKCSYANNPLSLGIFTIESTCSEQLNATSAVANCSAPICTLTFGKYPPTNFEVVFRGCLNYTNRTPADICEQARFSENFTTFNYGDGCCATSSRADSEGSSFTFTVCFCQKDNCNGDLPPAGAPFTGHPSTKESSSTVASPSTTLKPSVGDK